jgi:hypothetical protein
MWVPPRFARVGLSSLRDRAALMCIDERVAALRASIPGA